MEKRKVKKYKVDKQKRTERELYNYLTHFALFKCKFVTLWFNRTENEWKRGLVPEYWELSAYARTQGALWVLVMEAFYADLRLVMLAKDSSILFCFLCFWFVFPMWLCKTVREQEVLLLFKSFSKLFIIIDLTGMVHKFLSFSFSLGATKVNLGSYKGPRVCHLYSSGVDGRHPKSTQ